MTEANHANNEQHRGFWEAAIAEFYELLIARARKLVRRINVGTPEDLVHGCICRVLGYSKDPATVGKTKNYLYRSLHNFWADEVRRSRVGMVESLNSRETEKEMEKLLPPVEPTVLATQKGEDIKQQFEKLGPLTKEEKALIALITQHYTLEDIASLWGEDIYRTKTRWQRLISKQRYRIKKRNEREAAKQQAELISCAKPKTESLSSTNSEAEENLN